MPGPGLWFIMVGSSELQLLEKSSLVRLYRQACVFLVRREAHSLKIALKPLFQESDTRAGRLSEEHKQTSAARAVVEQRILKTRSWDIRLQVIACAHGGRVLDHDTSPEAGGTRSHSTATIIKTRNACHRSVLCILCVPCLNLELRTCHSV